MVIQKGCTSDSLISWIGSRGYELFKFGIVGGTGVVVYYAILWSLVEVLHIPVLLSTSMTYLAVTIQNYLLHFTWTFRSVRSHAASFPRFLLLNIGGFFMNWIIMYLGVEHFGHSYLIVQAVSILLIGTCNFALSANWIFLSSSHPKLTSRT